MDRTISYFVYFDGTRPKISMVNGHEIVFFQLLLK